MLCPHLQASDEFLGLILHIAQHVSHGLTVNDVLDVVAILVGGDVDGIRVAKEVVHVAQNLLIGTHEEHTDIVRTLLLVQRMERNEMAHSHFGGKLRNLAVRVASDVLQGGIAVWSLVQSLNGHDGEDLVNRPSVRQRMEQGEIAEVFICQEFVQRMELLRHMLHRMHQRIDFPSHCPVHPFNLRTGAQVQHAMREEVEGLLTDLLSIVPVLQHVAHIDVAPYLIQFLCQSMVFLVHHKLVGHGRHLSGLQHLHDEHRMVSRQRTSTLGDDVGMRNLIGIGSLHKRIHAVVHILLNGIIHRTLAVARTAAVIIHTQSTATIHKLHAIAHLMQLHIEHARLAQRILNAAYLRDLATDVEMDEFQALLHAILLNILQRRQQFARRQAKLAGIAAAFLPFARTRGSQLDADAYVRAHTQLLRNARDDFQFVELLHHNEDALAHLLSQQCQLYVVLVFIAIADDERIAVHVHCQHSMQFRFRTSLQPQIELLTVLHHLLHHRADLVHLDGVDDKILPIIAILIRRLLEAGGSLLDAVVDDVGETHQHRSRHIAQGKVVHHLLQIHLHPVLTRSHSHISLIVDAEIIHAPTTDAIQLVGVLNAPFSHNKAMICLT